MKKHKKPPSQRDRFIETARELECDESEERFNAALKRVVTAKPPARRDEAKEQ